MADGGAGGEATPAPRLDRRGAPGVPPLVLASGSATRARLLANAGIGVLREAPAIDETEVKAALRADGAPAARAAETLAELKALKVARRHPGALVVGCDQMLDCDGRWLDKPADREAARGQLAALAGRRHTLHSAVVVVRDGTRLWHHLDSATLTMRSLGPAMLDAYLEAAGDAALASVGGYQIEGPGIQLFSRIDGDYFTILGLPLLPLLDFLRNHQVVPA